MTDPNRREFLAGASGALVAAGVVGRPSTWLRPRLQHDLVVRGGTLIDPAQGISGRRDVGITAGLSLFLGGSMRSHRSPKRKRGVSGPVASALFGEPVSSVL